MCGNRDRLRVNARIWQRDRAHEHPFQRPSNTMPSAFQRPSNGVCVPTPYNPPWRWNTALGWKAGSTAGPMEASERDHDDALRTPTHMEGVRKRRWRSTYHAAISGTDRTTVLRCTLNRGDHDD